MIRISNKFGAKKYKECGNIYKRSLILGTTLSVIFTLICFFGFEIFQLLGQNKTISDNGGVILKILGLSIPFTIINVCSNYFLDAIKKPKAGSYAMLIANLINILFNWIFIYGNLGFDELGAVGSAWATLIVKIFLALYLIVYIKKMKNSQKFEDKISLKNWWKDSQIERKMGYGIAITLLAESASFASLKIFAGWMGETQIAIFTILLNIINITFFINLGSTTASSILIGNIYGQKNRKNIIFSAISSLIFCLLLALITLVIIFNNEINIIELYCNDDSIKCIAIPLFIYILYSIPLDSIQLLMSQMLRARRDISFTTLNQIISFSTVLIGFAYYFTVVKNLEIKGLLFALLISYFTSSIIGTSRFVYLCLRDKKIGVK